ncbi:MAG TPA: LON peptidase substrate-binding domain-containing protein, partial [Pyrinomonadaceae bacterium]
MAETQGDIQREGGTSPLQTQAVPFEIAVLPLQSTTLFPETVVPLAVGRTRSIAAVESALSTEEKLLACISAQSESETGAE